MAEARISQDDFVCSVCLDLLKDPVAIPCGHSYCKICITRCWDQEDANEVYSCPQCRETFSSRPTSAKNTILAEMVDKLKKTKPSADCYAGAGDVQCDVCIGRKHKAIKSCLVCQDSYCQTHFDRHEEFHSRKPHKMIDATGRLQDMICRKHEKELEMYCITDQLCICGICKEYEHKKHKTVSIPVRRTQKQKELKEMKMKLQQRVQQRQKDIQQLREAVESQKRSAQTAVEGTEKIFTEIIQSIKRRRSELTQMIRDQEKTAVSGAEELMEQIQKEIDNLKRRHTELEQLSQAQDHIHFLQSFQSLSAPYDSTDVSFSSLLSFDVLRESVQQLKVKLEDFCKEQIETLSERVSNTRHVQRGGRRVLEHPPLLARCPKVTTVPKTRSDFLQYSHQLTLDLNTVNKYLCLTESNRVINCSFPKVQSYPDHPDRFCHWMQVLCRESVCGRCYWEIECSGFVFISVSYKSISRKGRVKECGFGHNYQSWSLICSRDSYSFIHNGIKTELTFKSISSRIGVYVDHSAGTLSFYSISDTMSLIHTVHTTFTQPLYPGFNLYRNLSLVKLC